MRRTLSAKSTITSALPERLALTVPCGLTRARTVSAAEAASIKVENGIVKFYFETGKAEIGAEGQALVAATLVAGLKEVMTDLTGMVDELIKAGVAGGADRHAAG